MMVEVREGNVEGEWAWFCWMMIPGSEGGMDGNQWLLMRHGDRREHCDWLESPPFGVKSLLKNGIGKIFSDLPDRACEVGWHVASTMRNSSDRFESLSLSTFAVGPCDLNSDARTSQENKLKLFPSATPIRK